MFDPIVRGCINNYGHFLQVGAVSGHEVHEQCFGAVGETEIQKAGETQQKSRAMAGYGSTERTETVFPMADGGSANGWIMGAG